jgi:hypothetical protein
MEMGNFSGSSMREWVAYKAAVGAVDFGKSWQGREAEVQATAVALVQACRSAPGANFPPNDVKRYVFGLRLPADGFPELCNAMRDLVHVANFQSTVSAIMAALPGQIRRAGFDLADEADTGAWEPFSGESAVRCAMKVYNQLSTFFYFHREAALGHTLFSVVTQELSCDCSMVSSGNDEKDRDNRGLYVVNAVKELMKAILIRGALVGKQIVLAEVMLRSNVYKNSCIPSLIILWSAMDRHLRKGEIFFQFANGLCELIAGGQPRANLFVSELSRIVDTVSADPTPFHSLCRDANGHVSPQRDGILVYQLIWRLGYDYDFCNSADNPNVSIQRSVTATGGGSILRLFLHDQRSFSSLFSCMCMEFGDRRITPIQLAFSSGSALLELPQKKQSDFLAQMSLCFLCLPTARTLSFLILKEHGIPVAAKVTILEHIRTVGYAVRVHISKLLEFVESDLRDLQSKLRSMQEGQTSGPGGARDIAALEQEITKYGAFVGALRQEQTAIVATKKWWINLFDAVLMFFGRGAKFPAIADLANCVNPTWLRKVLDWAETTAATVIPAALESIGVGAPVRVIGTILANAA